MADEVTVKIVRLDRELPLPAYARAGEWAVVPTGIAVELPDGWAGFVLPRSGLAARHGLTCLNAPGLIDSGYRDEIRVVLVNHSAVAYTVARGDRIAQLVVQPVHRVAWEPVDALAGSDRGTGGFGHSGY